MTARLLSGIVTQFDETVGLGEVADATDGTRYPFHCIELVDGSRTVEVGAAVRFFVMSKLGRLEAAQLHAEGVDVPNGSARRVRPSPRP